MSDGVMVLEVSRLFGLIEKVRLLEERRGAGVHFQTLGAFPVNPQDPIDRQRAAREITKFVGLGDYSCTVAVATQESERVGGHIDLRISGRDVFIEVSPSVASHPNAFLATLGHEVAHLYLKVYQVETGETRDEAEILTDVAAVYIGLGKLLLDGCELQWTDAAHAADGVLELLPGGGAGPASAGGWVETHSLKTGYLTRSELAFVMLLVNAMHHGPGVIDLLRTGLSAEAYGALKMCEAQYYKDFFDPRFHEASSDAYLNESLAPLEAIQHKLSGWDGTLMLIRHRLLASVEPLAHTIHGELATILFATRGADASSIDEPNPALRFLDHIRLRSQVKATVTRVAERMAEQEDVQRLLVRIAKLILSNPRLSGSRIPENWVLECHRCGQKLRLPSDAGRLKVRCPNCSYAFFFSPGVSGNLSGWIARLGKWLKRAGRFF